MTRIEAKPAGVPTELPASSSLCQVMINLSHSIRCPHASVHHVTDPVLGEYLLRLFALETELRPEDGRYAETPAEALHLLRDSRKLLARPEDLDDLNLPRELRRDFEQTRIGLLSKNLRHARIDWYDRVTVLLQVLRYTVRVLFWIPRRSDDRDNSVPLQDLHRRDGYRRQWPSLPRCILRELSRGHSPITESIESAPPPSTKRTTARSM